MAVDLRPTGGMAAAARRGLRLHKEGRSGDGLKPETVSRAGKISRREALTPDHVREMNAWFARHEKASKSPGWNAAGKEKPGFVAWLLWGGDPAKSWAAAKVAQMDREKKMKAGSSLVFAGGVELHAGEADSPRKFTVLAYNGGPLRVNGWDRPVVIDLTGMEEAPSIVANLHHDSKAIVGHVTAVRNTGRDLQMDGLVSGANSATQEFLAASGNGFPWQASVEVQPVEVEEVEDGDSVKANGMTHKGPIYVARKSRLYGVAFLPRGADERTTVRLAAGAADSSRGENSMKFDQWIEAMGFKPESLTDQQREALEAKYAGELEAVGGDEKDVKAAAFDIDAIKASYEDVLAEYESAVAQYEEEAGPDYRKMVQAGKKELVALKAKAIKERWADAKFEAAAIRATSQAELAMVRAAAPKGPAIHVSNKDVRPDVIEAALCMSAGLPRLEKKFKEDVLEAAHKNYRNLGLQQLLLMAAGEGGMVVRPGDRIHAGNFAQVMNAVKVSIQAGNGFSTLGVSVSNLLSTVANKELLDGYTEEDQTWRQIAGVKTVRDFKTVTRYRLLDNMAYEKIGPTGEIPHGTVSQESYATRAETYGKMFSLTRTDIINDDLGAFDDLRTRLGAGAAQNMNDVFWREFMDNAGFFTSARGNYISGGTTNLGDDGVGLGLGVAAFRTMKSPAADGAKRIGGNPSILLVPPELEAVALRLYNGSTLVGGNSVVPNTNIYVNRYRPVVCPWLSDSAFTGYSATAWYLLREPTQYPTIVVSFLNGQQAPTVESSEADFSTLGIQFRGYHDFGCDQAEPFGAVMSKGAA